MGQDTPLRKKFTDAEGIDLTDRAAWDEFVRLYEADRALGRSTIKLAFEWARLMQAELAAGRSMDDIAWETYLKADDSIGSGAVGSMAKTATYHLGQAWKYGPALVAWHNRMARTPGTAPYIVGPIDPDPAAWKP